MLFNFSLGNRAIPYFEFTVGGTTYRNEGDVVNVSGVWRIWRDTPDSLDNNWQIDLYKSGSLKCLADIPVQLCVVGGGGGGSTATNAEGYAGKGGGGGGGGGYVTNTTTTLTANHSYTVTIGAGGAGSRRVGNPAFVDGQAGGQSKFGSITANGGKPALGANVGMAGGDGGSGGTGGGVVSNTAYYDYVAGGSNGSDGATGYTQWPALPAGAGGTGQHTSTYEFGDTTGRLFASGGRGAYGCNKTGSGGSYYPPSYATANTGNGGDGEFYNGGFVSDGGGAYHFQGGAGGSGIVTMRNPRS